MKKSAVILIVLFSTILSSSLKRDDKVKNLNNPELVVQLMSIVTSILQGKFDTGIRENISPEAYVISNNNYESIFELMENSTKKEKFMLGKDVKANYVYLWMPDDQKSAYMVLETKSAGDTQTNWHSILFKIGQNQKWQIFCWHKS